MWVQAQNILYLDIFLIEGIWYYKDAYEYEYMFIILMSIHITRYNTI